MSRHEALEVGEWTFDVELDGPDDGETVLLLHGFPQTSRCWALVAPELAARGYRTIAPNQRGYGAGARPIEVEQYRMAELVGDVVGLLDRLGLPTVHVVGHDWGAAVAWQVAARHPDRVRSLTALSVPHPLAFAAALAGDADQKQRSSYMRLFLSPAAEPRLLADDAAALRTSFTPHHQTPDTQADIEAILQPGALTAALNWYRAMTSADQEGVGAIKVPTTFVWGAKDPAIGPVAATGCEQWGGPDFEFVTLRR